MNKSCNYEKIKKQIEMENKNVRFCCVQGPKGDPGPTTITVGMTKTGDAGTNASVTNSGTTKDVILDFLIPRGEDGEKIAIGTTYTLDANARAKVVDKLVGNVHTIDFYIPQGFDGINGIDGVDGEPGPKGEDGKSEQIEIAETITLDAGMDAEVEDDFDGELHSLTFSIPKGEKGDPGPRGEQGLQGNTGPAGPAGADGAKGDAGPKGDTGDANLSAYASIYEDKGNSYTLTGDRANQVELSIKGENKNMDTSFTNTIRAKEEGVFKVDYYFIAKSSIKAVITLELRKESVSIPASKLSKEVDVNGYAEFNGSTIVTLQKGEKLDLGISSSVAATLTPDDDITAYLNVMRIS